MNKNKIYELLSEGKITDAVSTLLEELEGPELDNEAKELENVATEESKPEVSAEKVDNQDVYPADEHKETEEVKEVVVESDQVAAGPELKEPKELENEATEEREPKEDNLEKDNQDVYCDEVHDETEDVAGLVIESIFYTDEEFNDFAEQLDEESLDRLTECYAVINALDEKDSLESLEEGLSLVFDSEILNEGFIGNVVGAVKAGVNQMGASREAGKVKKELKKVTKQAEKDYNNNYAVKAEQGARKAKMKYADDQRKAAQKAIKKDYKKSTGLGARVKNYFSATKNLNTQGMTRDQKRAAKAQARATAWNNTVNAATKAKKHAEKQADNTQKKMHKQAETEYKQTASVQQAEAARKKAIAQGTKTAKTAIKEINKRRGTNVSLAEASESILLTLDILYENGYELTPENVELFMTEAAEGNYSELVDKYNSLFEEVDNVATEERAPETMEQDKDNQDVYPADEHKETEEVKEVVVEDSVVEDILDSNPEAEKAEDNFDNPEQVAPTASETAEEVEKLLDVNPAEAPKDVELSESMKAIFSILDKINESAQVAAGPELKEPKELENEATEESKPEVSVENKDNQDVYPADEHKETEEVKEVVVESAPRKHKSDDTGMSHVETKYEYYDDNDAEDGEKRRVVVTKKSVDHVDGSEEILSKEDRVNKGKSGRKYGSLKEEIDNVATEERAPETMEQDIDNKDVYNAPEHKEVEEVVEVVVEAAKLCSENGVPATLENITKYAKTLFESEAVALNVDVPADKEYDVDAEIESSEMNGNKEEFKEYEEIQGDGAEAAKAEESVVEPKDLHETVKYTSLREACLLDEDYFVSDSYTIQTADEKQAKLTEQISLLMAREAMDPLYDELLRASTNAQRLQEACVRKYSTKAKEKAKNITRCSGENNTLNEGKFGNFLLRGCVRFLSEKSLIKF